MDIEYENYLTHKNPEDTGVANTLFLIFLYEACPVRLRRMLHGELDGLLCWTNFCFFKWSLCFHPGVIRESFTLTLDLASTTHYGPFGLFFVRHQFPFSKIVSGFLWVKLYWLEAVFIHYLQKCIASEVSFWAMLNWHFLTAWLANK